MTTFITKISNASPTVDISAVEIWLNKKKAFEIGIKNVKKICFISVDKCNLTIWKLFSPKEIFKAFNKKHFTIIFVCLCQLFCNYQTIKTCKNVIVIDKYEAILNFDAKIYIQKPKFTFWDEYFINFFRANLFSINESIMNNLNMCNDLSNIKKNRPCSLYKKN